MRAERVLMVVVAVMSAVPGWCQQMPAPLPPPSTGHYLLKAIGSLLIVVALILLTYYALRKLSWPQPGTLTSGPVELLQVLPVEPGRRIYVIGIRDRAYIVAWSQDAVALIGEVERAEVDETLSESLGD
jgi:flagellar biogenesis protein FliO